MNNHDVDWLVIWAAMVSIIFLLASVNNFNYVNGNRLTPVREPQVTVTETMVTTTVEPEPDMLDEMREVHKTLKVTMVTVREMELTELGTYFVTAYCPAECGGSWSTASGATCHRADWDNRYSEPTTCAIDRNYHWFGEEFYIEEFDRVFVAEDTGPGVQGRWLDLFYEDYEDVLSFPTGYYTVYSVQWVEETYITHEYNSEVSDGVA